MNTIEDYSQRLLGIMAGSRNDARSAARTARDLTREALANNRFVLACVERVVASIESAPSAWPNPPLYTAEDPGVSVRLIFWPAGYASNPHVHNTWSVTGIFHNEMMVDTFKEAVLGEPVELGPMQSQSTHRGEVGYLLPPCVHRLRNASARDSATFHVLAADDYNRPAAHSTRWFPDDQRGEIMTGIRNRALGVCCEVLRPLRMRETPLLLLRIFEAGSRSVKLQAIKALASHDVSLAYARSCVLEAQLEGPDREQLHQINQRLAESAKRSSACS